MSSELKYKKFYVEGESMTFGENVKAMLRKRNIKQNELARRIGMSSSGITTAISADANPRESTIRAIAEGLGCTIGELMDEKPAADILTMPERRLLEGFRCLNDQGQEYIMQTVYTARASGIYKKPGNLSSVESVTG